MHIAHWFCTSLRQSARHAFVGVLCLAMTGCLHRRLTVRTDPPGARVYIDDHDIGITPCSAYFTYYGTRKIRLEKDGFETQTIMQDFQPPWYEYPPLDFVSENLWPHEIRDQRVLDFQLIPQRIVPGEEVLKRAEALRQGIRRDLITPLPVLPGGTGGPPAGSNLDAPSLNSAPQPSPILPAAQSARPGADAAISPAANRVPLGAPPL